MRRNICLNGMISVAPTELKRICRIMSYQGAAPMELIGQINTKVSLLRSLDGAVGLGCYQGAAPMEL